jgi:hypothetical protein
MKLFYNCPSRGQHHPCGIMLKTKTARGANGTEYSEV